MKVAVSSASFDAQLRGGDLTQLEWLELCGSELDVNGVVFDAAHFPRTDEQYLAQLAKLALDHGLCAAAVRTPAPIGGDDESVNATLTRWLDVAVAVRAPLLIVRSVEAGDSAILPWQRALRTLKLAAREAKQRNVGIAMTNAMGTLCTQAADFKRFAKDVDSAWLRYALAPAHLSDDDIAACRERVAIVLSSPHDITRALQTMRGFRGYVAIETNGPDALGIAAILSDLNRANRLHIRV